MSHRPQTCLLSAIIHLSVSCQEDVPQTTDLSIVSHHPPLGQLSGRCPTDHRPVYCQPSSTSRSAVRKMSHRPQTCLLSAIIHLSVSCQEDVPTDHRPVYCQPSSTSRSAVRMMSHRPQTCLWPAIIHLSVSCQEDVPQTTDLSMVSHLSVSCQDDVPTDHRPVYGQPSSTSRSAENASMAMWVRRTP